MRKDVKLGLAVGGILFGAVMAYVLFFAGGAQNSRDQAPLGSHATADASQQHASAPQDANQDTTTATGYLGYTPSGSYSSTGPDSPLNDLANTLPGSLSGTPTTQPAGNFASSPSEGDRGYTGSNATISIAGPGSNPTPLTDSSDSSDSTLPPSTDTWDWQAALENGAEALAARTATPTFEPSTGSSSESREASHPTPLRTADADSEPATPANTGPRTYIVKPGDTYWSIAKAEYGNAAYYPHLARANANIPPSRLRAGMKITLPAKRDVVPESAARAAEAAARPVDPTRQYRVQTGDNLYTICKKLYGRADRVAKLYELNKHVIGPNPSHLKPNMVLELPDPPMASSSGSNTSTNTATNGGSWLVGSLP